VLAYQSSAAKQRQVVRNKILWRSDFCRELLDTAVASRELAQDRPSNRMSKQLGDTRLGGGPVLFRGPNINPRVLERLQESAKTIEVPVQVRGTPRATGTDANTMQLSREGVAVGLIGIPNRYMHSPVEVVCLDDLDRAARLLAEFCATVTPQMDWTP